MPEASGIIVIAFSRLTDINRDCRFCVWKM